MTRNEPNFLCKLVTAKRLTTIMLTYSNRIVADHRVMLGKPIIKGTRITVEIILRKMAEGATAADLLQMYPHLQPEDVVAALQYAASVLANEEVIDLPTV